MKKLLALLTVVFLMGNLTVSAAESRIESYVNKKIAPITEKEKAFNSKVEAQKKANLQKQEEYKKQQAAKQAEIKKKQEAYQTKKTETKEAIKNEKEAWKSLLNK